MTNVTELQARIANAKPAAAKQAAKPAAAKQAAKVETVPVVEPKPAPQGPREADPVVPVKADRPVMSNPDADATYKQAAYIAGLTGFFPSNKQGWTAANGFTKAKAAVIIDTVLNGGSITVNGHTFAPKAKKSTKAA